MKDATANWAFRLAAGVLLSAAVYHCAAAINPAIEKAVYGVGYLPGYPSWRHLLWVSIDVSLAGLLLRCPWWLLWPYIVMLVEQLHGHGGNAWRLWAQSGRISWIDVGVLAGEFLLFFFLILDRHERSTERSSKRDS